MADRYSNLNQEYFDKIVSGEKTIEGRPLRWLVTDDLVIINIGDVIEWKCRTTGKTVLTQVRSIKPFKTFEAMYVEYGEKLLPGVKTKEEAAAVYRQWYEKEMKDGSVMLAFKLKIVENLDDY